MFIRDGVKKVISMIVAVDEAGNIGKDGHLPWVCKNDMDWFKKHTKHKAVVMGRKTAESIPNPLKDRMNIVLSKSHKNTVNPVNGKVPAPNLMHAIEIASAYGYNELVIIGGAEIYRSFVNLCDKIYVTQIFGKYPADTKLGIPLVEALLNSGSKECYSFKDDYATRVYVKEHETLNTDCRCMCFSKVKTEFEHFGF